MAFAVGDWVRLIRRPAWAEGMQLQVQQVIDACVGGAFRIDDVAPGPQGELYVLLLGEDIDARFGGFMNDLRVEAEYLEPAAPPRSA